MIKSGGMWGKERRNHSSDKNKNKRHGQKQWTEQPI